MQWCLGLVTFLWPGLASHLRAAFLPIHVFSGLAVFVLAAAAALLGLTEKALFRTETTTGFDYKEGGGEAVLTNLLGLAIVLFTALVLATASRQSFRRLNRAEDQMLLTEGHTE